VAPATAFNESFHNLSALAYWAKTAGSCVSNFSTNPVLLSCSLFNQATSALVSETYLARAKAA